MSILPEAKSGHVEPPKATNATCNCTYRNFPCSSLLDQTDALPVRPYMHEQLWSASGEYIMVKKRVSVKFPISFRSLAGAKKSVPDLLSEPRRSYRSAAQRTLRRPWGLGGEERYSRGPVQNPLREASAQ